MRLLVSVRSAAEVTAAVAGGADIVDAKEPNRGSLGRVTTGVLAEILDRVPRQCEVSVALGDVSTPQDVIHALAALPRAIHQRRVYLKFGFAGISSPVQLGLLLKTAINATAPVRSSRPVIAVAYADAERVGSASPHLVCRAAVAEGAAGILLDTAQKAGGGLFRWMGRESIAALLAQAQRAGLLGALAGGLGIEQIGSARRVGADIVGFRGAACLGGREGQLDITRVRELRQALGRAASGSIQDLDPSPSLLGGETPEGPANPCRQLELTHEESMIRERP